MEPAAAEYWVKPERDMTATSSVLHECLANTLLPSHSYSFFFHEVQMKLKTERQKVRKTGTRRERKKIKIETRPSVTSDYT